MLGTAIVAGAVAAILAGYFLADIIGSVYGNGGIAFAGPF